MRGYSELARRDEEDEEQSWRGERKRGAAPFLSRSNYTFSFFPLSPSFSCGFAPLHSSVYSSHVRLPPGRNNNCYYSSPRLLQFYPLSLSLSSAAFSQIPVFRPPSVEKTPESTRNAHNYGHVTRLISCLNSSLGPDRPISSFDKEGSTIANRQTRFEHTLFTLFSSVRSFLLE